MAKIYARKIREAQETGGGMTIDDVPLRWREQVRELLGNG